MTRDKRHWGPPGWLGGRHMTPEEEQLPHCKGKMRTVYVRLERTKWTPLGLMCLACHAFFPADAADTKYICDSCGHEASEEEYTDADALYECGDCIGRFSEDYSADGYGHRCPNCKKFAEKVCENGCPACGEGELEEHS